MALSAAGRLRRTAWSLPDLTMLLQHVASVTLRSESITACTDQEGRSLAHLALFDPPAKREVLFAIMTLMTICLPSSKALAGAPWEREHLVGGVPSGAEVLSARATHSCEGGPGGVMFKSGQDFSSSLPVLISCWCKKSAWHGESSPRTGASFEPNEQFHGAHAEA
ncbi:hypothetical protein MHYP_G00137680 [Metynnis hypsauchen]